MPGGGVSGRRVRIAAHVHSEWSYDAHVPLDVIARTFARFGYDAVLMAEHDRGFDERRWIDYQSACASASTSEIMLIPGMEYEDADNIVHTAVWGDGLPFLGAARPTLEILREAHDGGAATLFAHPNRRNAIDRYRPEWRDLLSAVEIWNRKYDGVAPFTEAKALANREGLAGFVSLDFHTRRQLFPLAMTVPVSEREPLSRRSVVAAIRAGGARSDLLRFEASRFTHGVPGALMQGLEGLRRSIRTPLRRLTRM